jgi:hypothetical protein
MALLTGVAATPALGAEITIAGPLAAAVAVADADDSPQPTISYWQYTRRQAQTQRASGGGRKPLANVPSVRGSFYRPQMTRRDTFRYQIEEFHRRRFDNLRSQTHRGRFGGRSARYAPAARYTTSFGAIRTRRPSTIRYGFQR